MANSEKAITELENNLLIYSNRSNNIVIFNVEESNRETMEERGAKMRVIIDIKINSVVDIFQIDYTGILGGEIGKRPILVRFLS